MRGAAGRWALALLLLSPTVIVPGGLDRFVFGKVAFAAAGASAAVLARPAGRLPRHVWALLAAGVALLAAAAVGPGLGASAWGRAPRYEGALVLATYVMAAVAGARLLGPGATEDSRRSAVRLLSVAAALVALVAVAEAVGLRPLSTNLSRPGSLLGNASDQGVFGVLALGVCGAAAVRRPDRWPVVGAVAAGVAVALSGSRGALLGAAVTALVLIVWAGDQRRRSVVATGLLALGGLAFAIPATASRLSGTSPFATRTAAGRLVLWRESIGLIAAHPALGVGPSRFVDAIPAEHDTRWYAELGTAMPVDSPHNWLLQAAASGGVGLALLALALAALLAAAGVRRATAGDAGPLAALAGYGAALLVHVTSPGPACVAAVLGGALLAAPPHPVRARRGPLPATLPLAAGALLTAVLVFAALAELPLRSGIEAVDRGDLAAAERSFATARVLRPWDAEIDATAAHALTTVASGGAGSSGNRGSGAAAPYLRRAERAFPRSEQVLADAASDAELASRYPDAERLITRALALDPHNPELLLRKGVLRAEQDDLPGAERLFLAVTRIDERSAEPWDNLARVYELQRRPADAARARKRADQLR